MHSSERILLVDAYDRFFSTDVCFFCQLSDRNFDVGSHGELLEAVKLLVSEDQCEGKFVYGRKPSPKKSAKELQKNVISKKGSGGENPKSHLQTLLARAGHQSPSYKITQLKNNKFRATVIFNGLNFSGQPSSSKKDAEKDAAAEALQWLTGETQSSSKAVEHMSALLKKSKSKNQLHSTKWR